MFEGLNTKKNKWPEKHEDKKTSHAFYYTQEVLLNSDSSSLNRFKNDPIM